jgi:hypothetical protein
MPIRVDLDLYTLLLEDNGKWPPRRVRFDVDLFPPNVKDRHPASVTTRFAAYY